MALPQEILFTVFFFAVGACVGSFLNVVIWRLPNRGREVIFLKQRGRLTLSWPASHCPVCDSPIRWYQNIPVISWLALRGHCAVCRTDIPVRYPLVELGTAVLFAAFYLAYFVGHWPVSSGQPWFTDIRQLPQAGVFAMHLVFAAALLAAAAIDADLFIIPLSMPLLLVVLGIAGAVLIDHPAIWELSPKYWWAARPIVGAVIGLAVANVLLWIKVLPRSFSAEDVELQRLEAQAKTAKAKGGEKDREKIEEEREEPLAPPPKLTRFGTSLAAAGVLLIVCVALWVTVSHKAASLAAVAAGILIFLIGVLPRDAGQVDVTDEVMEEISSPFARREILKEAAFLLIPVAFAALAYAIPLDVPQSARMARVLGSLWGLLVGGGVVWAVRIFGTLVFNREAMGLGDVHLMAGVGVVVGPILATLAFFIGPFIAIPWIIVLKISGKPSALPYGPWLAVASILCLLIGYPMLEWYITHFLPKGMVLWG